MTTTTVTQLIEWLKTQDPEALVKIKVENDKGNIVAADFDPAAHGTYIDYRGNEFVKPHHPYFGGRYLFIGD